MKYKKGTFNTKEEIIHEGSKIPDIFTKRKGVYFLLKDNEIVYVGKSNCIFYRIATHFKDGRKDFDSFSILEVEDTEEMGTLEAYYIATLSCKHNTMPADKKYQKLLFKLLLQERSGESEILEKPKPSEKQIAHRKKMSEVFTNGYQIKYEKDL